MTCNLCENDYGISLCNCSYLMCHECINKLETPNCPQCRSRLIIKYFFAGKITTRWQNEYTRRFVIKAEHEDFEDMIRGLQYPKIGNLKIKNQDVIDYDNYINVEQELNIQQINPTTAITGPYVIVDNLDGMQHGIWERGYLDVEPISDIVNKRNYQAIENCDVFVLELNFMYDCFRSIAEWGIASALGKTLIILFPDEDEQLCEDEISETERDLKNLFKDNEKINRANKNPFSPREEEEEEEEEEEHWASNYILREFIKTKSDKMQSEFYMFAAESIKTLDKLSFTKKEAIFTSHPTFNITYREYVKKLQSIISKKRSKV